MKKINFAKCFVLISGIILFIFLFYRYHRRRKVEKILNEWRRKTNGYVDKDSSANYYGDYYLSFNKHKDDDTHVHLVVDNCCSSVYLCYIIKKHDEHSETKNIWPHENETVLVDKMLYDYENFTKKRSHRDSNPGWRIQSPQS